MVDDLRRVLRGDALAWTEFFARHVGTVQRLVRSSRSMGSYRQSEDHCRDVVTAVFERLQRDDFRALRTFPEWQGRNPTKSFSDWLTVVTTNVVKTFVASKLGPRTDGPSAKQMVNTLAGVLTEGHAPSSLPQMTQKETVRQILDYARRHLAPDQTRALSAWIEGSSFGEIAHELKLGSAAEAERLLRASLARLRRQFADE